MSAPIEHCEIEVKNLGTLKGNVFEGDIQQFMGVPYGTLTKRWTRATMVTKWEGDYHDGTVLGPCTPVPLFGGLDNGDILTPVFQFKHYNEKFTTDEKNALVANITIPNQHKGKLPVFVFIHGGSWMYGTSNLSIFDGVKLVRKSVELGKPIIAVTFNYRCGYSGFLASDSIRNELKEDGFSGNGNFGLTDQALALDWISTYIESFGGDSEEVTISGESAGGCSVSNHIFSNVNPKFKRVMAMSGLIGTIPAYPSEWHEKKYRRLLDYYKIENDEHALEKLRNIPEAEMASATHLIDQTKFATTGNPCIDGWYLTDNIDFTNFIAPPEWLEGLILGDTRDEGEIFMGPFTGITFSRLMEHFNAFVEEDVSKSIFELYGITPDISDETLFEKMKQVFGDFAFVFPNYMMALKADENGCKVYHYHFDETSTLDNGLKGTAYHAIDLLYLFGNRPDMETFQFNLVDEFMARVILFARGEEPWEKFSERKAAICFGPRGDGISSGRILTVEEDTEFRSYSRFESLRLMPMINLKKFYKALDYMENERKPE